MTDKRKSLAFSELASKHPSPSPPSTPLSHRIEPVSYSFSLQNRITCFSTVYRTKTCELFSPLRERQAAVLCFV